MARVRSANVKARPILMSAPMVRAMLDGRKTQTRRLVKPQPPSVETVRSRTGSDFHLFTDKQFTGQWRIAGSVGIVRELCGASEWRCPYGVPGDHLWIRETWQTPWMGATQMFPASPEAVALHKSGARVVYAASWSGPRPRRWRPSIHMPRWASRLTLDITDVRVQRLQDISGDDARAEGCIDVGRSALWHFEMLWKSINGEDSWDSNPYVWAISFRREAA